MVPIIKSILLVADFSTDTGYVLDHAIDLAQKYKAKIHIIFCIDIMQFSTQSKAELYQSQIKLEDSIENSLQEHESHIRGRLKRISHERLMELRADESLIAGIDIERTLPLQAILDAVAVYHADLIVMGAQRNSELRNVRLGSITRKILNEATVPVFVVKGGEDRT
jgi:nucleotide-binding universal stress UspA family protein